MLLTNPGTKNPAFREFDSSRFLDSKGGIPGKCSRCLDSQILSLLILRMRTDRKRFVHVRGGARVRTTGSDSDSEGARHRMIHRAGRGRCSLL